jgi:exopolyphosphatase/guanosine-5'-triphosphate,3'-diphosphate pyrophosphatase
MVNKCVIDVGSNTIKLFIADTSDPDNIQPIDTKRRMTRLGKDVHKTDLLPEEGKSLVLKHIQEYLEICKQHNVDKRNILVTATAACRNASDGKEFINKIKAMYELPNTKVLSGEEEAEFTFLGVLESIKHNNSHGIFYVIDVGGGSFQISKGTKERFLSGTSIQKGCNVITEKFNLSQKVTKDDILATIKFIKELDIKNFSPDNDIKTIVGVGGTLKIMQLMLKNKEDTSPLQLEELYQAAYSLAPKTSQEIFEWFKEKYTNETFRIDAGLTINRAEVILSGICIVIGLLEKFSAKEVFFSKTDAKNYVIKLPALN